MFITLLPIYTYERKRWIRRKSNDGIVERIESGEHFVLVGLPLWQWWEVGEWSQIIMQTKDSCNRTLLRYINNMYSKG